MSLTLAKQHDVEVTVVDSVYALSEVPDALRRFGEARHTGKIIIRP